MTDAELERQLGDFTGLVGVDMTRVSRLLQEQLAYGIATRTMHSFAVTDVLQALEGHRKRCLNIRAFRRPPLKGLLHAHFVQPSYIPKNLANELRMSDGLDALVGAMKQGTIPEEKLSLAMHAATMTNFEKRAARNALTGEWIVYAKRKGRRYYLSLAAHDEGDKIIYQRILDRCLEPFRGILLSVTA